MKKRVFSGVTWEEQVAYCRAIRVNNHIFVSGTTAVDENNMIVGDKVYDQTVFIFKKIEKALIECGSSLSDVVRTRTYMTNIDNFDGFAKAHQLFFKEYSPAATCIEVSRFVKDGILLEIEVDAVIEVI